MMDEGRKRVLLIAASILRPGNWPLGMGGRRPPWNARLQMRIALAERILSKSDAKWPNTDTA